MRNGPMRKKLDKFDLQGLSVAEVLDLHEQHRIGHRLALEYSVTSAMTTLSKRCMPMAVSCPAISRCALHLRRWISSARLPGGRTHRYRPLPVRNAQIRTATRCAPPSSSSPAPTAIACIGDPLVPQSRVEALLGAGRFAAIAGSGCQADRTHSASARRCYSAG